MKRLEKKCLVVAMILICNICIAKGQSSLKLIENGMPRTIIVTPSNPNGAQQEAARILADHLLQISGAEVKIIREEELQCKIKDKRIILMMQ